MKPLATDHRFSRAASVLVLLAVFCFCALQATEGLHQHPLGDASDLCLVCKADSGASVADLPIKSPHVAASVAIARDDVRSGTRVTQLTPPVRGPPHIS